MFTGIIQSTGVVADVREHAGGLRLHVEAGELARQAKAGDSICVSGVCLTVAAHSRGQFEFDVVRETLAKSTLGALRSGNPVNLEPALRAGDRLDGHFVQGHVDGTATVQRVVVTANQHVVWLRPQQHLFAYIIPKGSIAIDGVSLTVAALDSELFSAALIPTTLERTTLAGLQAGDAVNLESDMMVRTLIHYLQRLLGTVDEGAMAATPLFFKELREGVLGSLQMQGVP